MDWRRASMLDKAKIPPEPKPVIAWWLTFSPFATSCSECGEPVSKGQAVAWNHAEQRSVCQVCIDRLSINVQPSKKYLAALEKSQREQA
jgi:hypothetical protein